VSSQIKPCFAVFSNYFAVNGFVVCQPENQDEIASDYEEHVRCNIDYIALLYSDKSFIVFSTKMKKPEEDVYRGMVRFEPKIYDHYFPNQKTYKFPKIGQKHFFLNERKAGRN
jgi:hypothetical protein